MNYKNIERLLKKTRDHFLNDTDLTVTITYKKLASSTFDPSTGTNTETYEEYELEAVRNDTSLEAQAASTIMGTMGFENGQKYYLIKHEEMPRSPYDKDILKDYIVDGGKEYQIKKAAPYQNIMVKIKA